MNSQELRIGNWIIENLIDEPRFIQVEKIVKDDDWSDCSPIPLTSDILLKAGFKKSSVGYWVSLANLKAELHVEVYKKEMVFQIMSNFTSLILDPIKHLHTLQNLFFALTGTELNITLP